MVTRPPAASTRSRTWASGNSCPRPAGDDQAELVVGGSPASRAAAGRGRGRPPPRRSRPRPRPARRSVVRPPLRRRRADRRRCDPAARAARVQPRPGELRREDAPGDLAQRLQRALSTPPPRARSSPVSPRPRSPAPSRASAPGSGSRCGKTSVAKDRPSRRRSASPASTRRPRESASTRVLRSSSCTRSASSADRRALRNATTDESIEVAQQSGVLRPEVCARPERRR